MRTYLVTIPRVFCVLSFLFGAALTGCVSSGARAPGANEPCTTSDNCAPGYQCLGATTGAKFCCKDPNNCGPSGSGDGGGAAKDGTVNTDGPSSKGGALDVASAGGAGGSAIVDGGSGGAGGGITGGNTSGGGAAGGLASGGVGGGIPASGGIAGGVPASGGAPSGGVASGGIAAGGSTGGPDAAPDAPLSLPDAPALLALGKTCTLDIDCALGNCVDGVCCNKSKTACGGCNACTNALTGLDDGTCGLVSAGKDPHNACTDETTTSQCGNDGTCDGSGACRKVSSSHICTAASCSSDGKTFTPATTCDGKGACTIATLQPCGAFQCATTGCMQTCTLPTDCVGSNYCDTAVTPAVCKAKKTNGAAASQKGECTSNIVADGVCCDKDCSGCSACTLALNGQTGASVADGQCLAVIAGQVGHGTCTANPPCGLDGKCDGNGACRYTTAGTSCAADSCSISTLTTKACDSTHACSVSKNGACPGLLTCGSATACKTSCTAESDCTSGNYCASGTCTPKLGNGATCTISNQCPSGNTCVEGVCCNTACGTACHSCLASKTGGTNGTCAAMTDATTCGSGSGQYCSAGICISGCAIGGTVYATGTVNSCQSCQPTVNATQWTPLGNGTSCGTGKVCSGGNCQTGCWIGGNFMLSGTTYPTNTCQVCNPAKSTSGWSNNDGASVSCGTCGGTAACANQAPGACSKNLVTYYLDFDGDGYGDSSHSIVACSPPSGYVLQGGDLCDSNPGDPNAHPGQTAYFYTPDACGSFDYNCDGTAFPQSNGPALGTCGAPNCQIVNGDCVDVGGCTCAGSCRTYGTAACGKLYETDSAICEFVTATYCTAVPADGMGTQACN